VRSRGCASVRLRRGALRVAGTAVVGGRWRAPEEEVEGSSGEEEVDRWSEPGAGVAAHLPETNGAGGLTSLSPLAILRFSPFDVYYSQ
jgi:hypothetical protein